MNLFNSSICKCINMLLATLIVLTLKLPLFTSKHFPISSTIMDPNLCFRSILRNESEGNDRESEGRDEYQIQNSSLPIALYVRRKQLLVPCYFFLSFLECLHLYLWVSLPLHFVIYLPCLFWPRLGVRRVDSEHSEVQLLVGWQRGGESCTWRGEPCSPGWLTQLEGSSPQDVLPGEHVWEWLQEILTYFLPDL